ncbi:hypothetical protein M0R72_08890 [Candidatus Pacearchaeota archaeon]|jgi:hypothetical protein|nr:hypothetical protein [Candidatus Pacearchaeota archaeon]
MITEARFVQAIQDGEAALRKHPEKRRALVYPDGFVPNAYGWPAPGTRIVVTRQADGTFAHRSETYDRKRSYGRGSYITLWRS